MVNKISCTLIMSSDLLVSSSGDMNQLILTKREVMYLIRQIFYFDKLKWNVCLIMVTIIMTIEDWKGRSNETSLVHRSVEYSSL